MISRRQMAFLPAAFLLAQCSSTGGSTTTLAQAQAYADDLISAVSAAAQAYLAQPNAAQQALVQQVVSDLQTLRQTIDAAQATTTLQTTFLQVIVGVQQLVPIVEPFLGSAGPYVPLALAVLQAFVASLPPPSNAPPAPPAALHAAALKYHPHK